jgi:hypothetical protein
LEFSPGIGNSASAAPEPASYAPLAALMLVGLLWKRHRSGAAV